MATNVVVKVGADLSEFNRNMDAMAQKTERTADNIVGFGRSLERDVARPADTAGRSVRALEGHAGKLDRTLRQVAVGTLKISDTFGILSPEIAKVGSEVARTAYELGELHEKFGHLIPRMSTTATIGRAAATWLGPIGIAAGVTGAAVYLLGKQFTELGTQIEIAKQKAAGTFIDGQIGKGPHVQSYEMIDLTGRTMKTSEMTGRRAHVLENSTSAAPGTGNSAYFKVAQDLAGAAVTEWKQASDQLRPITSQIAQDWTSAWLTIQEALTHTNELTRDQINQLYALKGALLDVARIKPPTDRVARMGDFSPFPTMPSGPQRLNPTDILGSARMNATPSDLGLKQISEVTVAVREGSNAVRNAITHELPLMLATLIRTKTTAGNVGALIGGSFGGGFAGHLGDLASKKIGGALGAGVGSIIPGLGTVVGGFVGGAIGDFVGGLFHRHKKPVDDSAAALAKLAKSAERVNEAITNLPIGIKLANIRYNTADPETPPPPSAPPYTPPPGSNPDPSDPGTNPNGTTIQVASMVVIANSPTELAEEIAKASQSAISRGGSTPFTLAMARIAANGATI